MASDDKQLRTYNWPLNGRLITKLDGTLLPDSHFQVLENLRYNDGGIEGVGGMTKVKAAAFAKLKDHSPPIFRVKSWKRYLIGLLGF